MLVFKRESYRKNQLHLPSPPLLVSVSRTKPTQPEGGKPVGTNVTNLNDVASASK